MSLKKGDWASANGPYLNTKGEVKTLKYLETVKVLAPANEAGEVFVVGQDSHIKAWVFESSLTYFAAPNEWKP